MILHNKIILKNLYLISIFYILKPMNIKKTFKFIWLFIFSLTHPATLGLLIFCLGKKLNITFSGSTNITLINGQQYFFYAITFTIVWYTALYLICLLTKNNFLELLDYNLGIKYYPIYTTLLKTNILWLLFYLIMLLMFSLNEILLTNIIFILFIILLSHGINMLHMLFAIYGCITLKTFYTGMEGNIFGFLFFIPFLFLLLQSFALFIKQSWMLITKQLSLNKSNN